MSEQVLLRACYLDSSENTGGEGKFKGQILWYDVFDVMRGLWAYSTVVFNVYFINQASLDVGIQHFWFIS